jgi:type I site-specific restriction-modification system R (restriction) subunit
MSDYTENHLVEQPAIQLMQHELGWDVVNCFDEWSGGVSNQGRDGKREVVLVSRLRPALQRLNPDLPVEAIEGAVEEICRDRTALSLAEANREIDKLLKQGVKISFPDQEHGVQRVSFHEKPSFHGVVKPLYFVNPRPFSLHNPLISPTGEIDHFSEMACHFLPN